MVTRLYLVRHAEAEGNVREFFQGNIDTDLTEKGRAQLACLAERFRDVPLEAVYTSPFQRALQTAEAVNLHHGLELHKDFALREISGGCWEGKKWADLPQLYPQQYACWTQNMKQFHAPDGDAMTDVYNRMRVALTRIAAENPGRTIAVVSHGCALRNFLAFAESGCIEGLPDVGWSDNTAVSLVEYDCGSGAWTLIYKNDSTHLPPALSTLRNSAWNRYEKEKA
ncbi:MAG: histidine phosphatase family protein [Oscillospiraceae bacterium]|nr:histidine phosphatase family protein [Oscillospiraceae bacterium]